MAHIVVGVGDEIHCRMVEELCELEGHVVTRARSQADTIAALRSSLHPLVVVLFYEGITSEDLPDLFELAVQQRQTWAPHAYIVGAWWDVAGDPRLQALITQLAIPVRHCPFDGYQFIAMIEEAGARVGS